MSKHIPILICRPEVGLDFVIQGCLLPPDAYLGDIIDGKQYVMVGDKKTIYYMDYNQELLMLMKIIK